MYRKLNLIFLFNILFVLITTGQVRVRLFASQTPESALFTVTGGSYELRSFTGGRAHADKNETVLITRFDGKLAVKKTGEIGFICDSLILQGETGKDYFSLRINDGVPVKQFYSGDLQCYPDLETLVMINNCNIESYVAGVVRAEGGTGRNKEYIKTQAIMARTYMYKYFNRHLADRYNVCDNTHCQAFNGISNDSVIERASMETKGLVILDHDSILIISAFHSNCGGETSVPEDVWLASVPYLKTVADPYCIGSRNASWERKISLNSWIAILRKAGYAGKTDNPAAFTYIQKKRENYYRTGSFTIPLSSLRSELNLKSAFFSVIADGDSIILRGRGYGHGVGLCQEGAMAMAVSGSNYRQIIDFYYSNVIITDVKNSLILPGTPNGISSVKPLRGISSPKIPKGGL